MLNVLLLIPDYLASSYGQETFLYQGAETPDREEAIAIAQKRAEEIYSDANERSLIEAQDFYVLLVFSGQPVFKEMKNV